MLLIFISAGCVSCSTQTQLYNWAGYDDALYAYTKQPDKRNIDALMSVYIRLIENPGGSRKTPPPGVCADYGYLLMLSGNIREGRALLMREVSLYPESRHFVNRILNRFELR